MKKSKRIQAFTSKEINIFQDVHGIACKAIDNRMVKQLMRSRPSLAHKGDFGHTLVIAGNEGSYGAAILTCMAALRTGCGLITACVPPAAVQPLLGHLPEAMVRSRQGSQDVRDLDLGLYSAIAFGPGVGITPESREILIYLLTAYKGPLIIDADGLTVLSQHDSLFPLLRGETILTPHPKEFSRLCHTASNRTDMVHAQLNFYKKYEAPILLKGMNTTIVTPGGLFFNTTGNNGMATAGSGDVLTGIIASLCSQKYAPGDAALLGTYLHGFAGDAASEAHSMHSMIASDIVDAIKHFFIKFETYA